MVSDVTPDTYQRLHAFRSALRRFLRDVETVTREAGIESQQYQLMLAIKGLPEDRARTVGALADELLIRHHSAVELVDRLERKGYVERARSTPDRREVVVALTPPGEAALRSLAGFAQHELSTVGPQLIEALSTILHPRMEAASPEE